MATLIGFLLLGYRLISFPAGWLRRHVPRGAGVDFAATSGPTEIPADRPGHDSAFPPV